MALSKKAKKIKDAVEGDGKGVETLCGRADTKGSKIPARLPTQSDRGEYNNADLDRLYNNIESGWEGTAADETPGSPYGNVLGRVKITRVVKSNNDTTDQQTPNT
jgi:hypothetical protein